MENSMDVPQKIKNLTIMTCHAKLLQSCPIFATPWMVACQVSLYGILQVRILEWIAIPFSREPIPLVRTYFNEMKTICGRDITCTLKLIASIIDHRLEGSNLIVPWWLNG